MKKESKAKCKPRMAAVWAGRRAAKEYCYKMLKKTQKPPVCRDCDRVKDGRDCRGNPVGNLEHVIALAVQKCEADRFKLEVDK